MVRCVNLPTTAVKTWTPSLSRKQPVFNLNSLSDNQPITLKDIEGNTSSTHEALKANCHREQILNAMLSYIILRS